MIRLIRHPARLLVVSFAAAILGGAALLALPLASTGAPLAFIDALFMATSAVCVTGLAVVDPGSGLSGFGQAVLLGLVQIGGLGIIKTNVDSGQFTAVQDAGIEALLNIDPKFIPGMNDLYQARRDVLIDGLNSMGWNLEKTKATFYVWAPVPKGYDSMSFCAAMLEKCGIIVVPGVGYGPAGEGYVRFALTLDESRIKEALQRMKQHLAL